MATDQITSQEVMLEKLRRMAESLTTPPADVTPPSFQPSLNDSLATPGNEHTKHNGSPALVNGEVSQVPVANQSHIMSNEKLDAEDNDFVDDLESQSDGEVTDDSDEEEPKPDSAQKVGNVDLTPPPPLIPHGASKIPGDLVLKSRTVSKPSSAVCSQPSAISKPGFTPLNTAEESEHNADSGANADDEKKTVTCGDCGTEFADVQTYMSHGCIQSSGNEESLDDSHKNAADNRESDQDKSIPSDAESFDGKIVYNPDGSAYIIEGESDLSDSESLFEGSTKDGVIVDHKGKLNTTAVPSFPQIANAFYIQKNPAFYNAWYNMLPPEKRPRGEAPIMHSYRVFDVRSGKRQAESETSVDNTTVKALDLKTGDVASVPTKPILMCFICKLSFGYTKSFLTHALSEHSMTLLDEERSQLNRKNSSAIIQLVGKNKAPLMSFLEQVSPPNAKGEGSSRTDLCMLSNKVKASINNTSVSFVHSGSKVTPVEQKAKDGYTSGSSPSPRACSNPEVTSRQHYPQSSMESVPSDQPSSAFKSPHKSTPGSDSKSPTSCQSPGASPPAIHISPSGNSAFSSSPNSTPGAPPPLISINNPSVQVTGQTLSSAIQGIVIRSGCEDHPNGNITGEECAKCDALRRTNPQSLGGHMMIHSRNSCKTLKCPKCNWHYKYQETLEIHMKEKHPDNEAQCIYCITKQAHPRLARGEVYTCGYKPYRCEVCNYSTTTKGNLSIHMQSDKHINNMQELQKAQATGGGPPVTHTAGPAPSQPASSGPSLEHHKIPASSPLPTPVSDPAINPLRSNANIPNQTQSKSAPSAAVKAKPSWRCDVCNYETNVARNLRIHMTSEKHTHNMMMLQQNVNSMQRDMQYQLSQMALMGQDPGTLFGMAPGSIPPGMPPFAFDPNMMLAPGMQSIPHESPMDLTKQEHENMSKCMDLKNNNDPCNLYQCAICEVYSADSLESLHAHMQLDRTKHGNEEHVTIINGTYLCNLCQYKTNLKANFQLHCKTDKHLQRLQLVNHIREGSRNPNSHEWQLKYMANISNPVQVRCNACNYYTNSIHKLQLHNTTPRHEANTKLFEHLQRQEAGIQGDRKYHHCNLCGVSVRSKLGLIEHVRTMRHVRSEHVHFLKLKDEGREDEYTLDNIFSVKQLKEGDEVRFEEESAFQDGESHERSVKGNPDSSANNSTKDEHKEMPPSGDRNQHGQGQVRVDSQGRREMNCPLCSEKYTDRSKLESHLRQVHNVIKEGLHRLMEIFDKHEPPVIMNGPSPSKPAPAETVSKAPPLLLRDKAAKMSGLLGDKENVEDIMSMVDDTDPMAEMLENHALKLAEEASMDGISLNEKESEDQFRCQTCSKTFPSFDALCQHQNEHGHLELKQTPRGPGYLCWKKGCNQYFKTAESLQVHFREIHAKKPPMSVSERHAYKYRCTQCSLAFRTIEKLQLHSYYHIIRSATKCIVCSRSFRSIAAMRKHVEGTHLETMSQAEKEQYAQNIAATAPLGMLGVPGVEPMFNPQMALFSLPQVSMTTMLNHQATTMKADQSDRSTDLERSEELSNHTGDDGAKVKDADLEPKGEAFVDESINDVAFATNSYSDPSKKYKCHRCKVAFPKQSLIIQHNRTRLHRKGSNSTPEPSPAPAVCHSNQPSPVVTPPIAKSPIPGATAKFNDPNRPFKCDVCEESFTQKNILLVHVNSVSHLQKLQKMQINNNSEPNEKVFMNGPLPTAEHTSTQPQRNGDASDSKMETNDAHSYEQAAGKEPKRSSEKKVYKCNICKVAYSQGSALDHHLQSNMHQSRSAKLQELFVSGEVDITQPLIEQPESVPDPVAAAQEQNKAVLRELPAFAKPPLLSLSQHSLMPGLIPSLVSLPQSFIPPDFDLKFPNSKPSTPNTPNSRMSTSTPIPNGRESDFKLDTQLPKLSDDVDVHKCEKCGKMFNSQENLLYHQQHRCFMQTSGFKSRHTTHRSLLESIGFECVIQFNENHQKPKKKDQTKETTDAKADSKEENPKTDVNLNEKEQGSCENSRQGGDTQAIPELERSICNKCNKAFSSVWVLKTHQEEVHKDRVPTEMIELVASKFREEFDKKYPVQNSVETNEGSSLMNESKESSNSAKTSKSEAEQSLQMSLAADLATAQAAQLMQMPAMFGLLPGMIPGLPGMGIGMPPMLPMMMPQLPPELLNSQQGLQATEQSSILGSQPPQSPAAVAAAAAAAAAAQQKRARTRISDDQLKILRAHFDINNSPSEEQILKMSEQTGLVAKVIKHWFRNTLFKERQRNKDSPYNFSVPPTTNLNLEEYEKTGNWKNSNDAERSASLTPKPQETSNPHRPNSPERGNAQESHNPGSPHASHNPGNPHGKALSSETENPPKTEKIDERDGDESITSSVGENPMTSLPVNPIVIAPLTSSLPSLPVAQANALSSPTSLSLNSSLNSSFGVSGRNMLPNTPPILPGSRADIPPAFSRAYSTPDKRPEISTQDSSPTSSHSDGQASSTPGGHMSLSFAMSSRRANRTRFSDYQLRILQDYFDQNAYPKDDDLDHLSKMLGLSPRVIVVWFQNARQKARKSYENNPPDGVNEDDTKFSRTPGLNYQCKRCMTVFQRYYELIRHQRNHCYKDEESKLSMSGDNLHYSMEYYDSNESNVSESAPVSSQSTTPKDTSASTQDVYKCEKCPSSFSRFDQWKEHLSLHAMNSNLAGMPFGLLGTPPPISPMSAFSHHTSGSMKQEESSPLKRKLEEDDDDQNANKRMRTTILPEQLDYLYQQYQVDCNPSRKQLEQIADHVGLKKRVVQVWFQNTRARERKGQYRAHQQIIHKRCPFCRALFRAKSALESHLATKHPEDMARSQINVDTLPDEPLDALTPPQPSSGPSTPTPTPTPPVPSLDMAKLMNPFNMPNPLMPPGMFSPPGGLPAPQMNPLQENMKELYEASLKQFMVDMGMKGEPPSSQQSRTKSPASQSEESPLDLSKPVDLSRQTTKDDGDDLRFDRPFDDSKSETHSESTENDGNVSMTDSNPASPTCVSALTSPGSTNALMPVPPKRFRTQLSQVQVKIMKSIYQYYKTPTMCECELLGREIGLAKRVIQVWFQNARAKEKKAKMQYPNYNPELDIPAPPEVCKLCNFKYSHKYTVQDHLFSRRHIENVKTHIKATDRDLIQESGKLMWEKGDNAGPMASSLPVTHMPMSVQDELKSKEQKAKDAHTKSERSSVSSKKLTESQSLPSSLANSLNASLTTSMAAQMMQNPFAAGLPSMPGMAEFSAAAAASGVLPFMYPGMLPGMGMPPMLPGMMPGMGPEMFMYDPATFGTPLSLLQIPQQAIQSVQGKLQDEGCIITRYTQDCKALTDLKALVSSRDYEVATEAMVDVGYICRQCQMVYPGKEACMNHQQLVCYQGKNLPQDKTIIKLEQIQYSCTQCSLKFSTLQEYQVHCDMDVHKSRRG